MRPASAKPNIAASCAALAGQCRPLIPTQVLVCSNYHWMADPSHWMGGTLFEGANLPLLHNFIAGAVAARA